jgi:hypothetical protein
MTKNQIIAKAMLAALGIYAVITFSSSMISYLPSAVNIWVISLNLFVFLAVAFLVIRTFIFRNDGIARKITAPCENPEDFDRRSYLIKTFRIAFVILGLSLLCSSRTSLFIERFLPTLSLTQSRLWVNNLIHTGRFDFTIYHLTSIVGLIKLLLIAYLLCGGSHIIGWHLKNSSLNPKEEPTNE